MGSRTGQGPKTRRSITPRTQERVHRLAYDFEDMARRARTDGKEGLANKLKSIASNLGDMAREDDLWK